MLEFRSDASRLNFDEVNLFAHSRYVNHFSIDGYGSGHRHVFVVSNYLASELNFMLNGQHVDDHTKGLFYIVCMICYKLSVSKYVVRGGGGGGGGGETDSLTQMWWS